MKKSAAPEENDPLELKVKKCFTKHDTEKLYLIGKEGEWRKFFMATITEHATYLSCLECDQIQRVENNELIINCTNMLFIFYLVHQLSGE